MSDLDQRLSKLSPEKRALVLQQLQKKKASQRDPSKIIRKRDDGSTYPLSYAQQRMWFLSQWEPDNPLYNITAAVRIKGDLNINAFVSSIEEVVQRHEVLRAYFVPGEDGYPVQKIHQGNELALTAIDLQDLPPGEVDQELTRLIQIEALKPFDLTVFPLIRVSIIQVGNEERIVLLTIHHIVADGWSVGVFIQEVASLYEANMADRPSPLPEIDVQYTDFAAWQKEWMRGDVLDQQSAYWLDKFQEIPPPLELPTDRPRPAVQTFEGAVEIIRIPKDVVEGVRDIGMRENASLFMTLLTALYVLLHRYSGQNVICIGSPISNRGRIEIERLIGLFVNTLALKADMTGSPSFIDLLNQVKETTLSAYAHQDLPLEILVDELKLDRDLSRTPLFQVLFTLQDTPLKKLNLPTVQIEQIDVETGTSKFDLTLFLEEVPDGLRAMMEYNTDLFDQSTIHRMLFHYSKLLSMIVENPMQEIALLPLLLEDEFDQVINQWNNTSVPYPKDENLASLFEDQVQQTPDKIALQFGNEQLTYRQLNERANQVAHYLRKFGAGPETIVGLYLDRSIEMIIATLGIVKSGAAYMPLDPEYPDNRLAFMLEDGDIKLILSNSGLSGNLPESEALVIELDDSVELFEGEATENLTHSIGAENLLYVMYTSGSTGLPKGVSVTHRGVSRLVKNTNFSRMSAENVFLQLAPISFDAATLEIWGPFLNGGKLVVPPPDQLTMGEIAKIIVEHNVSVMWFTASLFHLIVDSNLDELGNLDQLLSGGDVLSVAHVTKFVQRHPNVRLTNGYGPTENTTFSTTYDIDYVDEFRGSVPIGRPIANSSTYILDRVFNPVPVGVWGELLVGGDGLARNYMNRPELTAERFIPNPYSGVPGDRMYRTGDLCRYRNDGTIEFLGRIDFQVKIRGFRVELGEIETAIGQYPGILNNVVQLHVDDTGSKMLVSYFVPQPDEIVKGSEIKNYLKDKLPDYMVPVRYIELEQMPITPNGKVDRRALPVPDRERPEMERAYMPPSTPMENYLVDTWEQVLGLDEVGIYDNFFELGGDSLKAAVLINRLQDKLGEQAHVKALFIAPTVAELSLYIAEHYPNAIQQIAGGDGRGEVQDLILEPEIDRTLHHEEELPAEQKPRLDEHQLDQFRRIIQPIPPIGGAIEQKNPPAVFILAPPRSGSTLLRIMLEGNQQLFAPPELDLLSFNTLTERNAAFSEKNQFWIEGVIRAIMEIKQVSADEATQLMAEYEARGMTTQQFYRQIQEWLGNKLLVDKTPVYALDPLILSRAEEYFDEPLYIHLTRHPYGSIYSFVESKLDKVFFRYDHSFSQRELAELIWIESHQNILDFLDRIPANRQYRLSFEDIVADPANALLATSQFLGIEYTEAMIQPYEGDRMTSRVTPDRQLVGDFKFYLRKKIDPNAADRWKKFHVDDFLSDIGLELADQIGYHIEETEREIIDLRLDAIDKISRDGELPLSFAQQRLWFLDQWEPGSPFYNIPVAIRLQGEVDKNALVDSINKVVERHEVLRTTFGSVDGKPVLEVADEQLIHLREIDLGDIPYDVREKEATRIAELEVRKPFDLSTGPLIRTALLNLDLQESILLLTIHHIAADGWSMGVLIREIAEFYNEFTTGTPANLDALNIQYVDYAAWQRNWLDGEVMERQLAYWKGKLSGSPSMLELPTDKPRPAVQSQNGMQMYFKLSERLSGEIKQLGNQEAKTLFMVLLAAFQILLNRYTHQTDINIGTPIANRRREEIENLIGFFVNTLVLRCDLSGDPTFLDLLDQVYQATVEAYNNQDVPFEKLVDELNLERAMSHTPLFQVMFTLQEISIESLELPNLVIEPVEIDSGTAKFDILLTMVDRGDLLEGVIEYNLDLFEEETIAQIVGHYQRLLEQIVADPGVSISELEILTGEEEQKLLKEWSRSREWEGEVESASLSEVFERQAAGTPGAEAVVLAGADGKREHLTFEELNRKANQLARTLRKRGVGQGQIVGVLAERSIEMIVGLIGIWKAGAAYLPLDASYPEERLGFMLEDARVGVLLSQAELRDKIATITGGKGEAEVGMQILYLDEDWEGEIGQEGTENLEEGSSGGDLAYVIYTSGSTGKPKGVMIEHGTALNLWRGLEAAIYANQEAGSKRISLNAPLPFDASVQQLVMLLSGHTLHIIPQEIRQDGQAMVEYIREHELDQVDCVPSQMKLMIEAGLLEGEGWKPQVMMPGGEAIGEQTWKQLAEQGEIDFYNMYGPTECTVDSTICRVWESAEQASIGRPIGNGSVYVVDERMRPVPVGVPGELVIGGAGVGRGYLYRPELTAEKFIPDAFGGGGGGERLYRTGDLVRYRRSGELEFLGRIDHQVKLRGFRIELGEIEAAILEHAGMREVAVIVREDRPGIQHLVAYLVEEGEEKITVGELREYLKDKLPGYMIPSHYVSLETMPLTPNGKVDRRALPEPESVRPDLDTELVLPASEAEEKLAGIWREVLGIDEIGVHDNFFELGGDSILSIQIIARANQVGLNLTPRDMFEAQSIADLALKARTSRKVHAEQGIVTGAVALTPIQRHFFDQNYTNPHHWNQSILFELAPVSGSDARVRENKLRPALEGALAEIIRHHDMLRTKFVEKDGKWHQTIQEPDESVGIEWVEINAGDELAQADQLRRIADEFQASLNITTGPLLRLIYFDYGAEATSRVLFIIHHLVIDGVSWRILLDDFQTAFYQILNDSSVILPAKTTSYKYWADQLVESIKTDEILNDWEYWRGVSSNDKGSIPIDFNEGQNSEDSVDRIRVTLSKDLTATLLKDVPAAYNTEINDILLAALTLTISRWAGHNPVWIQMEGHGREDLPTDGSIEDGEFIVDVSRTVGWFTTLYPVLLFPGHSQNVGETIVQVKEQLHRVPRRGFTYGILRYLGDQSDNVISVNQISIAPQVSFNYLGQVEERARNTKRVDEPESGDQVFIGISDEDMGSSHDPRNLREFLIDIVSSVFNGQLRVEWIFSQNFHRRATIEGLAADYLSSIETIIDHCLSPDAGGYTPSDFEDVELDRDQLEALLDEITE